MGDSNFVSVKEAASILGVSYAMVAKLLKTKRILAFVHSPKCIRIRMEDLNAYLDSIRTFPKTDEVPPPPVLPTRIEDLKTLRPRAVGPRGRPKKAEGGDTQAGRSK